MEIFFAVIAFIAVSLALEYVVVLGKLETSNELLGKLVIENEILKDLVRSKNVELDSKDAFSEDFLKFLSDSRRGAFEYIETVQAAMAKFNSAVTNDISYFEKYSSVMATPLDDGMKRITAAYKELCLIFPEEDKETKE
jgi:hypothetical protein